MQNPLIPHAAALYHSFGEAEERSHCPEHLSNVQPTLYVHIFFPLNSAMPLCPTLSSTLPFSWPSSCHHSTEVCRIPPVSVLHKSNPYSTAVYSSLLGNTVISAAKQFFLHFTFHLPINLFNRKNTINIWVTQSVLPPSMHMSSAALTPEHRAHSICWVQNRL